MVSGTRVREGEQRSPQHDRRARLESGAGVGFFLFGNRLGNIPSIGNLGVSFLTGTNKCWNIFIFTLMLTLRLLFFKDKLE